MKKIALIILAICSLFPLYGCGDSNIDSVKEGTLFFDTATTIGNVFDSYPYFESGEWSSFEDQQKRVIVQFEGELSSDIVLEYTAPVLPYPLGGVLKQCLQDRSCNLLMEKVYFTIQFTILGDELFEISYVGTHLDNGESIPYDADIALRHLYSGTFHYMFSRLVAPQIAEQLKSQSLVPGHE